MAVAYHSIGAGGSGIGNLTWDHTQPVTFNGIFVQIFQLASGTDEVSGVTCDGVAMTEVPGSPQLITSGEPMALYSYFLGASIPAGTLTFVVTVTGATNKVGNSIAVTAAGNTVLVDSDTTVKAITANPSVTLSLAGKSCLALLSFISGQNAVTGTTPLTGWTDLGEADLGAGVVGNYRYDTVSTANVTAGFTQASEEVCMAAIAIGEDVVAYILALDKGIYAITGKAAGVVAGRVINAVKGAYVITGKAATFAKNIPLNAVKGVYTITGNTAGLIPTRVLNAVKGVYDIVGKSAGTVAGRILALALGSYTITGVAATLVYTAAGVSYSLALEIGSYVITGKTAGTIVDRALNAVKGTYAITGKVTGTLSARVIGAVKGVYSITGLVAGIVSTRVLNLVKGVYTLTGKNSSTVADRVIIASTGIYTIVGKDAVLTFVPGPGAFYLVADKGIYLVTGKGTDFTYQATPRVEGRGLYHKRRRH